MVRVQEQARRVKAAVAYSGKGDQEIADAVGTSLRSLRRWKAEGLPDDGDPRIVRKLTTACGLPYAFFTADFEQLWRIPISPEEGFIEAAGEDG